MVFCLSWYWIFFVSVTLSHFAFEILARPKGRRTQNIFCPHPHKTPPPPSYMPKLNIHISSQNYNASYHPKLRGKKTAYKTCLDFVSNSFVPLNWLKDKNHKTCHLPLLRALGVCPQKLQTSCWENKPEKEKPTTPGNRPTPHIKALAAAAHDSPSEVRLPYSCYQEPVGGRPPGLLPPPLPARGLAPDARCSRLSYLSATPPARRLRAVARSHAGAAHRTGSSFPESSPSFTAKSLGAPSSTPHWLTGSSFLSSPRTAGAAQS